MSPELKDSMHELRELNPPLGSSRRLASLQGLTCWLPYAAMASIAVIFYSSILPVFRPYAWVDDWIYAKPLSFTSASQWISWLFAQHADHRIPLQKATNFLILRASGFDQRWLVGINFAMACAVTGMLVDLARRYRGRALVGDVAIPLIILNFGMGYTQWGFHFHSMSSMFVFTCFVFSTFIGVTEGSNRLVGLGGLFLCISTLIGMNGTLVAIGASVAVIVWSFTPSGRRGWFIAPYYAALAAGFVVLLYWTPYTTKHAGVLETLDYTVGLTSGAFAVLVRDNETALKVAVGVFTLGALGVVFHRMLQGRAKNTDLLLASALGVFLFLMLGIAYGRTDLQGGWSYGSAIHYGVLAIYFPILSWIIVSTAMPRIGATILGLVLLAISVKCFDINYRWRQWMINYEAPFREKALRDLQSDKPVEQIVRDNLKQFLGDEASIPQAVSGITAFRAVGARLYGPPK